jgi:predicted transcriptional regulator
MTSNRRKGRSIQLNVGTLDDMAQRFVSAWHRAEDGERVRETHLTFPDLPALLRALTPRRLELLQALHAEPAPSVRALAARLKRDYKRVYQDVETLASSGLVERSDRGLRAPYDAIAAEMRL